MSLAFFSIRRFISAHSWDKEESRSRHFSTCQPFRHQLCVRGSQSTLVCKIRSIVYRRRTKVFSRSERAGRPTQSSPHLNNRGFLMQPLPTCQPCPLRKDGLASSSSSRKLLRLKSSRKIIASAAKNQEKNENEGFLIWIPSKKRQLSMNLQKSRSPPRLRFKGLKLSRRLHTNRSDCPTSPKTQLI